MARLAAIEKGEYYPTPLTIADQIQSYLIPKSGRGTIRLFDPCAGEGRALAAIADAIEARTDSPVETWGVEISPDRAAAAAERLDEVVEAPFEATTWAPHKYGAASFLLLNPPYDLSVYGGRMEKEFLEATTPTLVPDGILAYIIPANSLDYSMVRILFRNYEDVKLFRFGGEGKASFEQFKQVVIMARKRREPLKYLRRSVRKAASDFYADHKMSYPRDTAEDYIREISDSLPAGTVYEVRPTRTRANIRRERWLPEEIEQMAEERWEEQVEGSISSQLLTSKREIPQPLMPLSVGHIAQVTAAGLTGNLEGHDAVYKGRMVKSTRVEAHPDDPEKVIEKQYWETHMVEVTPDGLKHLKDPKRVKAFLQERIETFKNILAQKMTPYGDDITPEEQAVLDRLSLDKKLPNADERGLLSHQRRVSAAINRSIDRNGTCHLIAEMGYGKSRVSLAAAELAGRYPALIVAPPQVITKWRDKEAEPAIPGANAHIAESITELEEIRDKHEPGDKTIVIVPRSYFKLGPGWEKRYAVRRYLPREKGDEELKDAERQVRMAFKAAAADYERVRERLRAAKEHGESEARIAQLEAEAKQAREAALDIAHGVPVCPRCGKILSESNRKAGGQVACDHTVEVWDDMEREMIEVPCGERLYQFGTRYHRWPLADYIDEKMDGFFDLFIVDEVHDYKSRSSDQGRMFRLLAYHMDTITLTGTFSGGKSTDIFEILYATIPQVREDYAWDDVQRWIERFGALETTWKLEDETAAAVSSHGALLGTKRKRMSTKERPGISPGIVRYLLPNAVFASVEDLGLDLPPISEQTVHSDVTPRMDRDLSAMEEFTWEEMKEWWPHYTSAWLQWNLARPNSCFRAEIVDGYQPADDVPPTDVLPCLPVTREGSFFSTVADVLDLEEEELVERLRAGKSMAQVAEEEGAGKAEEILETFLTPFVDAWNARLREAAEDDDVSEELVRKRMEQVLDALTEKVNRRLTCEYDESFTPPPELLPKEKWLINAVLAEIEAGRQTVLYVRQTGTRDIRERLAAILRDAGVENIMTLDSSTDPRERDGLLEDSNADVLITNPKLVETGLDLVAFQNVIFFEPDYSAYVMWQATRRVWRPGQTEPVKVCYAMYEGCLEEGAYSLVGEKLLHAQLLHGEDVQGALVPTDGAASLTMSLIDALEEEDDETLRMEDDTLFTDSPGEVVSTSVSGSLTHKSQPIEHERPEPVDPEEVVQAAFAALKEDGLATDRRAA